jgi:hypothetical protein
MSDQDLADRYRLVKEELDKLIDELIERGYYFDGPEILKKVTVRL